MKLSIEEINLICIYQAESRKDQIERLRSAAGLHVNEPELGDLFAQTLRSLERMDDMEFKSLNLIPTFAGDGHPENGDNK